MSDDDRALLLVGGPDAGKTNFLVRLWLGLRHGSGDLGLPRTPEDIAYVETGAEHLLGGRFAPRSGTDDGPRDFLARVVVRRGVHCGTLATILVPDTLGELWAKAVATREIDLEWMDAMKRCEGAVLFVRIGSDRIRAPLDWVASRSLMAHGLAEVDVDAKEKDELPTQVFLCELLKYLEMTLRRSAGGRRPRVAVIVTAWDLLDAERGSRTPLQFLEEEFPIFAGRIEDTTRLEVEVFGSSVVGGDLNDDKTFKQQFDEQDPAKLGYIIRSVDGVAIQRNEDLTFPIAWLLALDGENMR